MLLKMRFLTIMLISALSFSCSFNHPKRGGDSALLRHDFLIDSESKLKGSLPQAQQEPTK